MSRVAEGAGTPDSPDKTRVRSQPWWQVVDTFEGMASTTTPVFTIDGGALQWRVKWSCQTGKLVVDASAHPRLVDATCPAGGDAYSLETGSMHLNVRADGPWRLEIEQQVDVPLDEPPLPAMSAPGAVPLVGGSFYDIDQTGRGHVTIYRLADDTHALRLDDFFVTPNVDLEFRLSPLEAPRSTQDYLSAPSALISRINVTAGSMNFIIPPTVDPNLYQSLVVWCPPLRSAYAAASLAPPRS